MRFVRRSSILARSAPPSLFHGNGSIVVPSHNDSGVESRKVFTRFQITTRPFQCLNGVQQQNACVARRRDRSTKQQERIRSKRVVSNVIRAGSEVCGKNHEFAEE